MPPLSSSPPAPPPLHIPDGFLSPTIAILSWGLALLLVGVALRRTSQSLSDRAIPVMGVMAAFIFAAQMINFPVAGGTSGHLLGGALAAIALGPWGGMLVMTAVVAIQALLFQDGGLLALGANVLNMGLLTALIGYGLYRFASGRTLRTRLAVAGAGAWLSVMAGALSTSLQLWLSGTVALRVVVPAMLGVHALIGLGEGAITVGALAFLFRTRPTTIAAESTGHSSRAWGLAGLLAALGVVLLSPLASTNPDGLERVAEDLGFLQLGSPAPFEILPDYTLPILGETALSTLLAGAIGVLIVAAATISLVRLLQRQAA